MGSRVKPFPPHPEITVETRVVKISGALKAVMPALVAGIHVFLCGEKSKTWMAGTKGRSRPSSTGYARP
jgi:hypothetical protein